MAVDSVVKVEVMVDQVAVVVQTQPQLDWEIHHQPHQVKAIMVPLVQVMTVLVGAVVELDQQVLTQMVEPVLHQVCQAQPLCMQEVVVPAVVVQVPAEQVVVETVRPMVPQQQQELLILEVAVAVAKVLAPVVRAAVELLFSTYPPSIQPHSQLA